MTITSAVTTDPRCVTVDDVDATLASLTANCQAFPITAAITADVFRAVDTDCDVRRALVTESLAYSVLQSGPEFARWLDERGPRSSRDEPAEPVMYSRDDTTLTIVFNRPHRHNAFNDAMRVRLLEALTIASLDHSISAVELSGNGKSFCSGGDLAEFGEFDNPASSHLARTRHSPALALDGLRQRLGAGCRAVVHGNVLGSGLEMAAFCGHIVSHSDARFALPELSVGLIPGAGGTFSVPRLSGRWRSAYLVLTGAVLDAETALQWGLVDEVRDRV